MNILKIITGIGVLLIITSACRADIDPEAEAAVDPGPMKMYTYWVGDDLVREVGEWKLVVTYLQKGTRSEGQDGKFFMAGQAVTVPPESLETPFGRIRHYGTERKRPWDITGWNMANRNEAKPAQDIIVTGPPPVSPAVVAFGMEGGTNTVRVAVGGSVEIKLTGRPSTGYTWILAEGYDRQAVRPTGEPVTKASDFKMPGAPEYVMYTFAVLRAGTAPLRFEYRRPWEKNKSPTRTAVVEVIVAEKASASEEEPK